MTSDGVLRRTNWTGEAQPRGEAFRLTKTKGPATRAATCEVWTHPLGWELRLVIEGFGLQRSQVERTPAGVQGRADEWKVALIDQGWA